MSLIPQINIERLQGKDLRKFPSLELLNEKGEYIGTLIVPSMDGGASIFDEIRISAEYLAVRSNIVVPQNVFDSLNEPEDKYPNLAKARATLKAKREGVKV